jgi:hypothetical protein
MSPILDRNMKFPSGYGIGVGSLIILQWIFFVTTGSVPEIQTTPWAIGFHIMAELLLACVLLISGIATLRLKPWGEKVLLVAIYREINSPGYFAQLGQWALVAMFALLLVGATTAVMMILKRNLT